jgi:hypothetical protein
MTHVVKLFDREKGLPFWYVEAAIASGAEAHAHLERESRRRTSAGEPQ